MNIKFGDLIFISPKDYDEIEYHDYLNVPIVFLTMISGETYTMTGRNTVALVNGLECQIEIFDTDVITILSSAANAVNL